jgi:phosphotriesterase-related protein
MARDSSLLAQLSRASGLHILTNTGLYKEPYLPRYAYEYSADELADLWVNEIEKGTDGTPIKAGFIKIAVNPGVILPIQQKIVRAAARCSRSTGAVIACHTVSGIAAKHLLEIINEEGLNPERLIVVHCDSETNLKYHLEIANQGAWVEYDAVREEYAERTLNLVKFIVDEGFEDRLLLSQDAGCYQVGEEKGGKIQSYAYLIRDFIPLMLRKGFKQELINKFLIQNPARAYKIESNL